MYLFGHTGFTVGAARWADRKADLRWAALLALLPDLIDKPAALLFPTFLNENTRGIGHSLAGSLVVLATLLLARRRVGTPLLLWACYLGHLVLDRMWLNNNPVVLLWPLFGPFPAPVHDGALMRWNLQAEAVGLAVVLTLAWRHRLFERARLKAFLRSGRLG